MSEPEVLKDARGAVLEVGDTCVYFKTGKYAATYVVRVVGLKKMVRIGDFDSLGARVWQTKGGADEAWASSSSLIKVLVLPHIPERLNVARRPRGELGSVISD